MGNSNSKISKNSTGSVASGTSSNVSKDRQQAITSTRSRTSSMKSTSTGKNKSSPHHTDNNTNNNTNNNIGNNDGINKLPTMTVTSTGTGTNTPKDDSKRKSKRKSRRKSRTYSDSGGRGDDDNANNNSDSNDGTPPIITRSETIQSTRSGRSIRSRQSQSSLKTTNTNNGSILLNSRNSLQNLSVPLSSDSNNNSVNNIPNSRRSSSYRRSSNNGTTLEPMTPILKRVGTNTSTNSLFYSENAITDSDNEYDDKDDEENLKNSRKNRSIMNKFRRSSSGTSVKNTRNSQTSNSTTVSRRGSSNGSIGGYTMYSTPAQTPSVVNGANDNGEDYFSMGISRSPGDKAMYPMAVSHNVDDDGTMNNNYVDGGEDFNYGTNNIDVNANTGNTNIGLNPDGTTSKKKKIVDIDHCINRLIDAGYAAKKTKNVCLKNYEISQICRIAREIFLSQPTLLELSPSVKIVGDVHGQYGDLLRLFSKCGFPPSANYLFLGDYVDRGKQSLETILLLLCYKIKYPENFFLLRGNHECANVTRVYGFYDECKRRCNIKTWKHFIDTFNTLPLAAIVTGKIFCVHGGLSPVLNSMDEIRHVSRPTDVPDFGLVNDLLWSDPTDSPNEWEDNERGVSYCYNKIAINKFLNKFGFDLVCRAHMVVEDGYEFFNDRSLVTVFSAPNYCGEFDNWGAVMTVSEGLLCSFELLDPLDKAALKQVMKKGRQERKLLAAANNNNNNNSALDHTS